MRPALAISCLLLSCGWVDSRPPVTPTAYPTPTRPSLPEEDCSNGLDDDRDGLADCQDPDCALPGVCLSEQEVDCEDGLDNDDNGLADCDDPNCSPLPPCLVPPSEVPCDDGLDGDGDGLVDCLDLDCYMADLCNGGEGGSCSNGLDDDGDGLVDCQDDECLDRPACAPPFPPESNCEDNIDNDQDGSVDCGDEDCAFDSVCGDPPYSCCSQGGPCTILAVQSCVCDQMPECCTVNWGVECVLRTALGVAPCGNCSGEIHCDDSVDGDNDGLLDCQDDDCWVDPWCAQTCCTPHPEGGCNQLGVEACVCALDSSCCTQAWTPLCVDLVASSGCGSCAAGDMEFACTNGVDDDADGLIDCVDDDCGSHSSCLP